MRQTTTPTIRISTNLDDLDIYDEIRIAIYSKGVCGNPIVKLKKDVTISANVVSFTLTQEETNILNGNCTIEMRVELAGNVIGFCNGQVFIRPAVDKVII